MEHYQLKDIANLLCCHEQTARRWWKRLAIPPDIRGHGPDKWYIPTGNRLITSYKLYYTMRGTTAAITRNKYAGQHTDAAQLGFKFSPFSNN